MASNIPDVSTFQSEWQPAAPSNRPSIAPDTIARDTTSDDRSSSSSNSSSNGIPSSIVSGESRTSGSSHGTRKRVKIVTDDHLDVLPQYQIQRNSIYRVSFPYRTWDAMMQGFRVALEMDNVFVCDHFLGREGAVGALNELHWLRDGRLFERHMRRAHDHPPYNYACLFLLEQEETHKQLDTLALMVYKLALYYANDWNRTSVELSYYPQGHREQAIEKQKQNTRKVLKCIYFPNQDWSSAIDPLSGKPHGMLTVQTLGKPMQLEPVFDRLVVFWGDTLDHSMAACPAESFKVTIWLQR